ncbi:uncharacterized protein B0H64DRAFT_212734 [Chaetomium fimeti]|uniref:Uncharacterized protein n=1 Tax=Chaetomium fimeti TaxID=1854472 RepID=A0AAE0HBK0_9PEZI|nr:hypothetical protein B0H64DRAFT_212734 [Chaetomium fimeti]
MVRVAEDYAYRSLGTSCLMIVIKNLFVKTMTSACIAFSARNSTRRRIDGRAVDGAVWANISGDSTEPAVPGLHAAVHPSEFKSPFGLWNARPGLRIDFTRLNLMRILSPCRKPPTWLFLVSGDLLGSSTLWLLKGMSREGQRPDLRRRDMSDAATNSQEAVVNRQVHVEQPLHPSHSSPGHLDWANCEMSSSLPPTRRHDDRVGAKAMGTCRQRAASAGNNPVIPPADARLFRGIPCRFFPGL